MNAIRLTIFFVFAASCGPQSIGADVRRVEGCVSDLDCPNGVCAEGTCRNTLNPPRDGAILDTELEADVRIVPNADVSQNADVAVNNRDVAVNNPDVAVNNPDVAVNNPDVAMNNPDVAMNNPDVAVNNPDVAVNNPDVAVNNPDVDPGPTECSNDGNCGASEVCSFDQLLQAPKFCLEKFAGGPPGASCERTTIANNESCTERLCLLNFTERCSRLCSSDSDCPTMGGEQGACTTVSYGSAFGACVERCERSSDCSVPGDICTIHRDTIANRTDRVCLPRDPDDVAAGEDCDSGTCANRLCVNTGSDLVCSEPCTRDSDCSNGLRNCERIDITRPNGSGSDGIRVCVD